MEINALKNQEQLPTDSYLQTIMKDNFPIYEAFRQLQITETGTEPEWRFYKDGNAWLGKMMYKKKNLGWIHVYNGYFKVTFYFMERHTTGIASLPIAGEIKEEFYKTPSTGKLIPMIITVTEDTLKDIRTILQFKKNG
ncbi:MAG: DUF3788 domain-containing protein [Tannerellaceae bacterium]|nr:DUF3788 domain-containing protein [Tannerellaceae bacterium]